MKKKKSIYNKLIYFINSIFAFLLLVAYVVPFLKPESLGSFAGISLLTPFLIIINLIFLTYWILRLRRAFLLSLFVLAIGYFHLPRLYKISGKKTLLTEDIKVMSYNVRMFNKYQWIKEDSLSTKINKLIDNKAPDIVCLQEYASNKVLERDYTHKFVKYSDNSNQFGHAIFSKFPIVDQGSLDFESTANNIIYADIKINKDTIRVYNIHLQSLRINPDFDNMDEEEANHIKNRISKTFHIQQHQVEEFIRIQENDTHASIVVGDFNNTAFSWIYRQIKKGRKDAFVEAGKGFDKTFDYKFPMRIDFIMVDESMKVNHFKTYREKYSDHFPILARIHLPSLSESE